MNLTKGLVSRSLAALIAGVPVGGAVIGVGNTAIALVRLPKATGEAYRALWRCEKIGPNLKTLISLTAPAVIVVVPPTVALASTVSGVGYGVYLGFIDPLKVVGRTVEVAKKFDRRIVDDLVQFLMDYRYELSEGEQAYDIRIAEALKGLLCVIALSPVETATLSATAYRNWWPLYAAARKAIWNKYHDEDHEDPETFLKRLGQSALTDLTTLAAIVGVPVVPLAAHVISVGDMTVVGYRYGLQDAYAKIGERAKLLHGRFQDFIRELRDEPLRRPQPGPEPPESDGIAGDSTFRGDYELDMEQ